MKIKPSTRTRLTGYFGIAVTTLLTPGGKLISSALAAATVAGVVGMNLPPKDEKTKNSAPPVAYTSVESNVNDLLNVSDLPIAETASDTLTPEMLASDQYAAQTYVPQENQSGFNPQSLPAANLVTLNTINPNTANAPDGFGVPNLPPLGPKSAPEFPPQVFPKDELLPPQAKCTAVIKSGDSASKGAGVLDEVICNEEEDHEVTTNPINPVLGEAPLGPSINDPEVLALPLDPAKGFIPVGSIPEEDAPPLFPKIAALTPDTNQQIQPLLAVAEISEPSTLAMLLLGLTGFGWRYRRKQPLSLARVQL